MTIIALSGYKGSGKDTAADYLVREFGYQRISFADRLKEMVSEQYSLPLEYMHDPGKKEIPLTQYPAIPGDAFGETLHHLLASELKSGYWTPRAILILEGSVKRAVYSNYWVRYALAGKLNTGANYVISDVRYKTEMDALRLLIPHELVTMRITRQDTVDTQDPSERDLDDYKGFDYYIQNKGTINELHEKLGTIATDLSYGDKRLE